MKIFSGSASQEPTQSACEHNYEGMGEAMVGQFSDGEVHIQIAENIRGKDVFIVNSTAPPINRNVMELLILIDAARRASAARVTAVLPYFGYARQDRKDRPRAPITAKLVSNLIVTAGADRVLTLDLHADQIQAFFDIPVDHLSGDVEFVRHLRDRKRNDIVVVSPDTGSVRRAREVARRLEAPLAIVDKRRARENEAEGRHGRGEGGEEGGKRNKGKGPGAWAKSNAWTNRGWQASRATVLPGKRGLRALAGMTARCIASEAGEDMRQAPTCTRQRACSS